MIQAGIYHTLEVVKEVDFGLYLDDGNGLEILLPKRFVPHGLQPGDDIEVFIYHDSDDRLIATTQIPLGVVGDIVNLKVVDKNRQGAFLDWGLMKDLFIPLSQQVGRMVVGEAVLVKIYLDDRTGRVAATQKFSHTIGNEDLGFKELDAVQLLIERETDLGYGVIVNNQHEGLLHYNDVFQDIKIGDRLDGFIKTIRPDNKMDVALGKPGYNRVVGEEAKILQMLRNNDGYLPYHDKSDPEEIYGFFGMSKKTFKMTIGSLYKQQKIELTQTGIKLVEK